MNNNVLRAITGTFLILLFTLIYIPHSSLLCLLTYAVISTMIISEIAFNCKIQNASKLITYIAYTYVSIPTLCMILIFTICDNKNSVFNIFYTSLISTFTFDTFAYIGGKLLKGPKIASNISPNKTISGTLVGFIAVLIVYFSTTNTTLMRVLLTSFLLSCGSFFGDLMQSKFKRVIGIKDMGVSIPGHGGFGDRFDGLVGVTIVCMFMYLIDCITR